MKRLLRDYPQEAALLSIYFEETADFQREERDRMESEQRRNSRGSGWGGGGDERVDSVIGGDDELDWSEDEEEGL